MLCQDSSSSLQGVPSVNPTAPKREASREDIRGLRVICAGRGSGIKQASRERPNSYRSVATNEGKEWLQLGDELWPFDASPREKPAKGDTLQPMERTPSDRTVHKQAVLKNYRLAHTIAGAKASVPLLQGRCCIAGLVLLQLLRASEWYQMQQPGHSVLGVHWLTTTSDLVVVLVSLPLLVQGTMGKCVATGCVGPMVTLVFSMGIADVGAFVAYCMMASPRWALPPGLKERRSPWEILQVQVGAWEFLLFASVSLQMAMCASCWRIYRELRAVGLYPPGGQPMAAERPSVEEVSLLEVVCEAEDVRKFQQGCSECTDAGGHCCAGRRPLSQRSDEAATTSTTVVIEQAAERAVEEAAASLGTRVLPALAAVEGQGELEAALSSGEPVRNARRAASAEHGPL